MSRPRAHADRAGQDPPASLGAVGRAVWTSIVDSGRYRDGDAGVLERYCQLHDRRALLLALVDTEGYVVSGAKQPTGHPASRLAQDIEVQMIWLEGVLARTSEARARRGLASVDDDLLACCGAGA
jgi:P27 family predicted phage terminase small subunit